MSRVEKILDYIDQRFDNLTTKEELELTELLIKSLTTRRDGLKVVCDKSPSIVEP